MSDPPTNPGPSQPRRERWPVAAAVGVGLVAALWLRGQGRVWWCACGKPWPWSGDVWSRHNSQHLFDPYFLAHVSHGLIFYGVLAWAGPRISFAWRLLMAVAIETAWEVFENSEFVIRRYREATISLDYLGDAIANSMGDLAACVAGFFLARKLGLRRSLALFAALELVMIFWIRDSLLINVVMLVRPVPAIKAWQAS